VAKRRAAGKDHGGRRQAFTDSQIRNAVRLIEAGEPATQAARDLGMSRATSTAGSGNCPCRHPSKRTVVDELGEAWV
jgi:DNA invertase Pin-like site-specific DNA recombinase